MIFEALNKVAQSDDELVDHKMEKQAISKIKEIYALRAMIILRSR